MQIKRRFDACACELAAGKVRLWQRLSERTSLTDIDRSLAAAGQVEVMVLECSRDLQQILDAIDDDVRLQRRLEVELQGARRELHEARLELVATRADEKQAQHTAFHDELTGLPNRASFRAQSSHALGRGAPHARKIGLMYIDLDGFKTINDVHGHRIGDELLKVIAARLERSVRAGDTISRHGGDEFLCLLLDVDDEEQVAGVARKLFDTVSAPCRLGDLTLSVTPSIGIAVSPRDGTTVEQLLQSADSAMYAAKQQRLGHAFFNDRSGSSALPAEAGRIPS
jgi:diguanylate cyclase (GGDEF)-like protein